MKMTEETTTPGPSADLFEQMAMDSEAMPSEDKLAKINRLYQRMLAHTEVIEDLETRLALEKKKLIQISDHDIPSAMSEAGCKKFVTENGFELEIKPFYTAKIDDNNREQCYSWLRSKGYESLIKHSVSANFNKGEDAIANKIKEVLLSMGITFVDKESVHPQTLTAFVKERITKGEDFPLTMFNVFVGNTTKVKRVK